MSCVIQYRYQFPYFEGNSLDILTSYCIIHLLQVLISLVLSLFSVVTVFFFCERQNCLMFTASCHFVHSLCGLFRLFLNNLTVSTAVLPQALHDRRCSFILAHFLLSYNETQLNQ